MTKFLFFIFLFIGSLNFAADPDNETWTALQLEYEINDKWAVLNEILIRFSHEIEDRQLKSNRIGVQYTTDSNLKIGNILENRTTANRNSNEFRNIFQISDKYNFENFSLSARLRWESRRFEDNEAWMTRFRLMGRLDFLNLSFYSLKPFLSAEQFYISNRVGSRLAGSGESRTQIGFTSKFFGEGKLDTSYMDRRVMTPANS